MKLKIWDDSMAEGQHEGQSVSFPEPHRREKTKGDAGFTPHSRYMRPQAKKIKVCIYARPPSSKRRLTHILYT
jgi:hypothetical protein